MSTRRIISKIEYAIKQNNIVTITKNKSFGLNNNIIDDIIREAKNTLIICIKQRLIDIIFLVIINNISDEITYENKVVAAAIEIPNVGIK